MKSVAVIALCVAASAAPMPQRNALIAINANNNDVKVPTNVLGLQTQDVSALNGNSALNGESRSAVTNGVTTPKVAQPVPQPPQYDAAAAPAPAPTEQLASIQEVPAAAPAPAEESAPAAAAAPAAPAAAVAAPAAGAGNGITQLFSLPLNLVGGALKSVTGLFGGATGAAAPAAAPAAGGEVGALRPDVTPATGLAPAA